MADVKISSFHVAKNRTYSCCVDIGTDPLDTLQGTLYAFRG
jgi:hypothetical protein